MTPEQATAMYRRAMRPFEQVAIRQYFGTGAARTRFDWTVMARVIASQQSELIGSVVQSDSKAIVLREDLVAANFPFPLTTDMWMVVQGKELRIKSIDDQTRRLGGQVIAYEIVIGGA
jgi:hypothetical protein